MIDVLNEKVFHLYNEKVSYIITLLKNNHLGHLYYGERLYNLNKEELEYYIKKENKAAGTVKYERSDGCFTLADNFQEYPVFGISDYKDGALSIYKESTPLYLDLKYVDYKIMKGKLKVKGFPASYATDSQTLVIELKDENYDIVVKQYYTIFKKSSVIARSQDIVNMSQNSYHIDKALSAVLDIQHANFKFVHLSGAWLKERHVKKQDITHGKVAVGTLKGASSHQQNPFIALESKDATINSGECYGMNLIYSGNFIGQVEVDEWDYSRMMLGIHPDYFTWKLEPGDCFQTPEAIVGYSDYGLDGLASEYAEFIEEYIIDNKWLTQPRPIVFNSWEAVYFDFDANKLLNLAKKVKDLGMECFVIDDGWFSNRNNDRSSLGDWKVNKEKFPHGINRFSKEIQNLGLQLGMWFEPEMISPDSMLIKEHPEWVVGHQCSRLAIARNQYVLDFSNPEVVDNIFNQMKEVIRETKLKYIKWDYNRNISEAYSKYLEKENRPQTEFFHRNILGLYDLYERITTTFPDVLIEGCAGGGGRYDLGILYYSPLIWASDDSDAVERLKIQYGTSLAYPISTISNHVSMSPNHQLNRTTPLQMRYHVALFGSLGYELDLELLSHEELEMIKNQVAEYKELRNIILKGTFHRIISPFDGDCNMVVWAIESYDKKKILLGIYRILARANDTPYEFIKLPFVDDMSYYMIDNEIVLSGEVLKNLGLRLPYQFNCVNDSFAKLKGDFQSYVFHIVKEEK